MHWKVTANNLPSVYKMYISHNSKTFYVTIWVYLPGNSSEVNGNIHSSKVPQSKLTGCVEQGKVTGLHTESQLCQPVRMFPCVGQGQTSSTLALQPGSVDGAPCGKVGKHNGVDMSKHATGLHGKAPNSATLLYSKNTFLEATAIWKEAAKPTRSMKFCVHI